MFGLYGPVIRERMSHLICVFSYCSDNPLVTLVTLFTLATLVTLFTLVTLWSQCFEKYVIILYIFLNFYKTRFELQGGPGPFGLSWGHLAPKVIPTLILLLCWKLPVCLKYLLNWLEFFCKIMRHHSIKKQKRPIVKCLPLDSTKLW